MPLILASNSASGYNVANSLRFNRGSLDQLTRTLSSTTDRQKSTWSCWMKKCDFTNEQIFFGYTTAEFVIYTNADSFRISNSDGVVFLYSTALQRDPSAWYHFVVAIDTTQATASNRIRMYVNGTEITSFSSSGYPTQNTNLKMNVSGKTMAIGSDGTSAFNGYMSEHYWIDGQQLTPSSFGETDTLTGIWKPKAYTGSFGTNGFYQKYANSAALGTDSSGNGNNFTVVNLTSVDQSTDTCTNNFCTLNAIQNGNGSTSTLTEGNLVAGTADNKGVSATFGVNRGKWFFEIKNSGTQTNARFGVSNRANEQDGDASPGANTASVRSYVGLNSSKNYTASSEVTNAGFVGTNGAIFGFALDLDNGTLGRYVNGSLISTDTTLPSDNSVTFFPYTFVTYNFGNWNQAQFNFGSPMYTGGGYADAAGFGNFSYAVPAGYYSLCTKNLANFG